ncbi:hypothetical protein G4V62_00170 [Bacillaceae bacterium SIJ1]|uniref:hypothetical protein n=1 Tax=Litoribacterium kuwaitense TaxID=1398745 RepID=UPI0013ECBCA9|nr:hypothetical protein [Litoribacterium kuwaitense]NGP43456.1 hypothetical protein [Litoribacterium kuwaitense]
MRTTISAVAAGVGAAMLSGIFFRRERKPALASWFGPAKQKKWKKQMRQWMK